MDSLIKLISVVAIEMVTRTTLTTDIAGDKISSILWKP